MLRNYLKIAYRNLVRNKVSSFINIGGLAVGLSVAMLIGLWIYDEISFNRYHENYDRIGQVMVHNGLPGDAGTFDFLPLPVAQELRSSFSGDFTHVVLSSGQGSHIIGARDKKFTESGSYMEPDGPAMLTLKMISGTRSGLTDPHTIMLAGSLAKKLFGTADPLNQIVRIDNVSDVKVTGVYEDLPGNSSFSDMSFITPWDLLVSTTDWVRLDQTNWEDNSFHIYVQLAPNVDFASVADRIKGAELRHLDRKRAALNPVLFVHPMSKWHLYSSFENRLPVTSEALKFVWFYGLIGIFVLLLACINFMNLSTARSEKRVKEVGIRKTMGSIRTQLIVQFYSESLLTAVLAFVFCIFLVQLILPWFDEVANKRLAIPWTNPWFWASGIVFSAVTGLLAGSYPALYLSSFRPVKVLKGNFRVGRLAAIPRKVLVVFQFTVSIALVIGTLVVYRQVQFAKNRPVGYSRAGLLQIPMVSPDFQGKYDILTDELNRTGVVYRIAESSSPVTGSWSNTGGLSWEGKDPGQESDFASIRVTAEYGQTVGFVMVKGRDFSKEYAGDSSGLIINEAAAKYMGLEHPVGERIKWENPYEKINKHFIVLGVVKDMVMNSPFEKVKQTIFRLGGDPGWISIKINPQAGVRDALPKIESVFKKIIPSAPFDYQFVDEQYAAKFAAEERMGKLASFFAVLAIFISCLGLFGLASFVAEQRVKEIGIRKVLGATAFNLWRLLSKDFVTLVLIALCIAAPIAFYFMHNWLQHYAYRSKLPWWIFASAGAGALAITLLTVSFQAVKAALANPVKALKSE